MPDNPQIVLEPRMVTCPRHGEPFREQWPKGYILFSVEGFKVATESEAFSKAAEALTCPPIERIPAILKKKPVCEWLTKDQMMDLYVRSEIGESGTCQCCLKYQMGTKYTTTGKTYRHLCFQCVLNQYRV